VNIQSNEARCTSCHAGYGWEDKDFDFSDQTKVDCLVCHEQTGTYKKFPTGAGNPVTESKVFPENKKTYHPPDYNKVAQSVSRPSRYNCGVCHFFGGGGDGVKHGDLDSSLFKPGKNLDVHMGEDGQNFDCIRCHSTTLHKIAGRVYTTPASKHRKTLIEDDLASKITCESCHGNRPHKGGHKANDHTDKVACQSCHIPYFARVNPTKMYWDWSTAGKKKDGKPYKEKGPLGKAVYDTKKGSFRWEKNVKPEYFWYNGTMEYLTVKDRIDPTSQPVALNRPLGLVNDPSSRIFPFKVHGGRQPYDKINKNMTILHLFPKSGDDKDAYWKGYDWTKAIASGQEYAGLDFSGEYDFIETTFAYPITHMVAPKENTVGCKECHIREQGRFASVSGVYMPGRDHFGIISTLGWIAVLAALCGVMLHGMGRILMKRQKEEQS
jgi:octaheme c-type cytochrome (tetrathionate reductase family)